MKTKLKIIFLLGFFCFVLTSCGAKVHTETDFYKGGNGQRSIYLEIADSDESYIKGGFSKLYEVLKEQSPDGVSVISYKETKGNDTIFKITYKFAGIEEYKEKTKQLTGKEPDISWKETNEAFQKSISYSETLSTTDLIQWAVDTIKEQYRVDALFDERLLSEEDNIVNFEDREVWQGKDNPQFTEKVSPKLTEIAVYTMYDLNNSVKKDLTLSFSYDDFKSMNLEDGLDFLKSYSENFKVDSTCNGYRVTLDGLKEIKAFLNKASDSDFDDVPWGKILAEKPETDSCLLKEKVESSVLYDYFSAAEVYNLNRLLENFDTSAEYIQNYLSVPETVEYTSEQIHHPYAQEKTKQYQYIGKYPLHDTYYMYFSGEDSVEMKSANVCYELNGSSVTRKVVLDFNQNGRSFTRKSILDFFRERKEYAKYEEADTGIQVTVIKEFKSKADTELVQRGRNGFSFQDKFSISDYFKAVGMNVNYCVSMPGNLKIKNASIGGNTLTGKEIRQSMQNKKWTYQIELKDDQNFNIKVIYQYKNKFLIIFIILVILAVLGILTTFYVLAGRYKAEVSNEIQKEEEQ